MPFLLLVFFALFFGLAFIWPTLRVWRREGANALVLPRDDSAQGIIGWCFRAVLLGIFILLAALALGLSTSATGPLPWLDSPFLRVAGRALLGLSLVWVILAQWHMGGSWRIGIDAASQPPLVRSGVFGLSRNPIFLGMRVSLLGLFLVLPNAFTLAILLTGEVLMQVQVRLEEEHLRAAHGRDYESYQEAVRRWL